MLRIDQLVPGAVYVGTQSHEVVLVVAVQRVDDRHYIATLQYPGFVETGRYVRRENTYLMWLYGP